MENERKATAGRLRQWVASTGLNMVDLAKRLEFPRTQLYAALNTGSVSQKLVGAITQHFPDTDMNWLLKGSYAAKEGRMLVANEPEAKYNRIDKARKAKEFLERDLVQAQNRVADSLDRIAVLMERMLETQVAGKKK